MNKQQFNQQQHHKRLFSRNKRYASTLLHMSHVDPHQEQLVLLIGMGHEKSNHEALCYWLSLHASKERLSPCAIEIQRLYKLLESTVDQRLNQLGGCYDR